MHARTSAHDVNLNVPSPHDDAKLGSDPRAPSLSPWNQYPFVSLVGKAGGTREPETQTWTYFI